MIKCIFTSDPEGKINRCNKEADYIYLGKSYCNEHMLLRAQNAKESLNYEQDKNLIGKP
jgi:hypothetical protein